MSLARERIATTKDGAGAAGDATGARPLHPYLVLLIAILLPGVGQVINNTPRRGLMFIFFIMSLGWITLHLAPPQASFVGRYSGAFFIYAIAVLDAYRWARYRWELYRYRRQQASNASA
jgi:hypothetical protein